VTLVVAFLVRLRDGAVGPGTETVIVKAIDLPATVAAAEATAGASVIAGVAAHGMGDALTSDLKVEKS
jgi:hypothetical protein